MSDPDQSVLFVHSRDITTPFGTTWPYYVTERLARNYTVHVLCRKRPDRRDVNDIPTDVVYHDINTGTVSIISGLLFVVFSTVYAVLLAGIHQYDVVYSFKHETIQSWLAARVGNARLAVGLQSVPVEQTRELLDHDRLSFHTLLYGSYSLIVRFVLEDADEVVCLTDGIRQVTEDAFDIDLRNAHVIGMGVETDKFDPDMSELSGCEPVTVTYLGTIHSTRGLDHVLEAIAGVEYDVTFRIVGSGSDSDIVDLKRTAADLGLEDRVDWVGWVPHDAVPDLLRSTDIAVSPLADTESYRISFPAKMLEYMAAGCLVIATDIPPHRNLIENDHNGFLYNGTADGFREVLTKRVTESPTSVGYEARRTAERYDWECIVKRVEDVIFP